MSMNNEDNLQKEIRKLENRITELNTELKNTKEIVKKYNNLRKDMYELAERMRAVEVRDEEEEKHENLNRKDTSIRQDWIAIGISLIAVIITILNVWG